MQQMKWTRMNLISFNIQIAQLEQIAHLHLPRPVSVPGNRKQGSHRKIHKLVVGQVENYEVDEVPDATIDTYQHVLAHRQEDKRGKAAEGWREERYFVPVQQQRLDVPQPVCNGGVQQAGEASKKHLVL